MITGLNVIPSVNHMLICLTNVKIEHNNNNNINNNVHLYYLECRACLDLHTC